MNSLKHTHTQTDVQTYVYSIVAINTTNTSNFSSFIKNIIILKYYYIYYYIISGSQHCSNEIISWDEANNFCKANKSTMLMDPTRPCRQEIGGGGEWIGLRKRWMFKSVNQGIKSK